ncbi:serine hydrolase [Rivularia sp. UHCC 0363]|uniref:serine hydrolase n=1 Tax=Rivularia sp. UHCC 0363 TaxID=3110244 RepID=UPI002B1F889B|nr:serine hydrolase [Rivularia sp. UHCC 0363]MEA5596673.1 serine hydrolase [Rivularia sp. UHCC 0363]
MRINDKRRSNKISNLQFASIVTGVALTINSIGLVLYQQQNRENTKQIAKKVNQSTPSPSLPPLPLVSHLPLADNSQLTYNITTAPHFTESKQLQNIVDEIVDFTKDKQFPIKPLSITLINLDNAEYAGYQQEKFRYPASVVKLFWMVYLYAQIEKGILSEADFTRSLDEMIKKSDNEAASKILDKITKTQYHKNIQGEEYKKWKNDRLQVNQYFQQAGYKEINVSQKTFPIPYLNLSMPKGSEFKLRDNPQQPIRNQISTQQVARLLYEVDKKQSVSATSSNKMQKLLTIDSHTRNTKKDDKSTDEFNSVRGFLSEDLPNDIRFRGKAGWTSDSRNDAAIISTPDGKVAYILVVFADDSSYAEDWKIFPQISHLVFERMKKKEKSGFHQI